MLKFMKKKSKNISDEDLKYLRELAEKTYVEKFKSSDLKLKS